MSLSGGKRRLRCTLMSTLRFATILLSAGCGGNYWGQRPLVQPTPVDRDDPVVIWSAGGVEKWHAVVITQDSVSGIPYDTSLKCASCRRSIPRAQVDSMKHYYRTLPENLTGIFGVTALIVFAELTAGLLVRTFR